MNRRQCPSFRPYPSLSATRTSTYSILGDSVHGDGHRPHVAILSKVTSGRRSSRWTCAPMPPAPRERSTAEGARPRWDPRRGVAAARRSPAAGGRGGLQQGAVALVGPHTGALAWRCRGWLMPAKAGCSRAHVPALRGVSGEHPLQHGDRLHVEGRPLSQLLLRRNPRAAVARRREPKGSLPRLVLQSTETG